MKVAIFHLGRCGSKMLINLLNSQLDGSVVNVGDPFKDEVCEGDAIEIIKSKIVKGKHFVFDCRPFKDQSLKAAINMDLDTFVYRLRNELKFDKIILLKRNNYIKKYVSTHKALESGIWHVSSSENSYMSDMEQVKKYQTGIIPIEKMQHWKGNCFPEVDKWYDKMSGICDIEMSYEEDIEKDTWVIYNKMCDIFNVEPRFDFKTLYKKTNPYPLSFSVKNYQDLETVFKGTQYEWMIYK